MDGSFASRTLRWSLAEEGLSPAATPKFGWRTDSLALGYALLLLWDFLPVWGTGYLCASAWQLLAPGVERGSNDFVLLIAIGSVVAPLLMRDRWSRIASSTIRTAGLMRRTVKRMAVIACVL